MVAGADRRHDLAHEFETLSRTAMSLDRDPSLTGQFRFSRSWLLRIGASVVLLTATLLLLPTEKVAESLGQLRWPLFLGVLALFLASHAVAAAKWRFLLGRTLALRAAMRAHFVGLAANLCLPGVAGGDVVRAALVAREVGDTAHLVTVSLADRLVDTLALALLAGLGFLLIGETLADRVGLFAVSRATLLWVAGLPVLAALAGGFLALPWIARQLERWSARKPRRGLAVKAAAALSALAARRGALALALAVSLAIQAGLVALFMVLAAGIGVEAPPAIWLFAWPLAKILAVAPISLGGIGVREASLAALMAPFGADPAGVVAASLIWQGVLFAAGALGAAMWVLTIKGGARAASQQPTR
jgi:uncharacterized protein (TIRG00374 family)